MSAKQSAQTLRELAKILADFGQVSEAEALLRSAEALEGRASPLTSPRTSPRRAKSIQKDARAQTQGSPGVLGSLGAADPSHTPPARGAALLGARERSETDRTEVDRDEPRAQSRGRTTGRSNDRDDENARAPRLGPKLGPQNAGSDTNLGARRLVRRDTARV